ncbi:MFS transporter [Streptacidiphilus sp. N1-10]|uniref:MFS transporter n=1 Tax=Streptacidiphilus jeojiensis TaxID=3229225 RepID=A0ABV6XGA5_9ACTN
MSDTSVHGSPTSSGPERSTGYYALVLTVILLFCEANTFSAILFYNALPHMSPPFTPSELPWIVSISLLVAAAAQPLVGKLADVFGFRRLVLVIALLYLAGSLLGAVTHSFALILVARALQGGIIALPAAVYAFFRGFFPKRMVPIVVGMNVTGVGVAGIMSPIVAGALLDAFGYQSIFWFCFIYIGVFTPLILLVVPRSGPRISRRIDVPGSLMITLGVGSLLFSLTEGSDNGWTSASFLIPLLVGLAVLVGFVVVETRVAEPMIQIRVLTSHAVRNSLLVALLVGIPASTWNYLFPQLVSPDRVHGMDYGFGLTALQAGYVAIPSGLCTTLAGPLGGYLCRRTSPRLVMIGSALCGLVAALSIAYFHSHLWQVIVAGLFGGVCLGFYFAAGPNLIIDAVPEEITGVATGIQTCMSAFMGSVMPIIMSIILAHNVLRTDPTTHRTISTTRGFIDLYWIMAGACVLGLAVALAMRHGRRPSAGDEHQQEAAPALAH